MSMFGFLRNRVWGFRMIEVSAFCVLIGLALAVYLAKVGGAKDSQQISSVERQIASERQQIRLLEASVAKSEQPARLEHLSQSYLQLAPAAQKQEVEPAALIDIARGAHPALPPAPTAPPVTPEAAR
jgi:hypothetical protein